MSEIEEPTPFLRGQDFGQAALVSDLAAAACCSGRISLTVSAGNDGAWLRMNDEQLLLDGDDAEFLAGLLIAYARRNQSKGTVKVPDIQPNSIYGEKQ